jgi:hypothetical protein
VLPGLKSLLLLAYNLLLLQHVFSIVLQWITCRDPGVDAATAAPGWFALPAPPPLPGAPGSLGSLLDFQPAAAPAIAGLPNLLSMGPPAAAFPAARYADLPPAAGEHVKVVQLCGVRQA